MKTLFLLGFMTFCLSAHAWREGSGGDGIRIQSQLYLLDLAEVGAEKSLLPIDPNIQNSFFFQELTKWSLKQRQEMPSLILAGSLHKLSLVHPYLAHLILLSIKTLDWNWSLQDLQNVPDENSTPLKGDLVQLANRINQTVYLQKNYWNELDKKNQAALIVHEALYALMYPDLDKRGFNRNSVRVRKLVGALFSSESRLDKAAFNSLLQTDGRRIHYGMSYSADDSFAVHFSDSERNELYYNPYWEISTRFVDPTYMSSVFAERKKWKDFLGDSQLCNPVFYGKAIEINVKILTQFLRMVVKELEVSGTDDYFYLYPTDYRQEQLDTTVVSKKLIIILSDKNCISTLKTLQSELSTEFKSQIGKIPVGLPFKDRPVQGGVGP